MHMRNTLIGLTLLAACPLGAQDAGKVQFGLTAGFAIPQDSNKLELSSGSLSGNGISRKTSFELGGNVLVPHSATWSSRWGFTYTFESPDFPVDMGDGTLAPRSAKRNQLDVYGQGVYAFDPAWYGFAGLDYVTRTLSVGGTDLDTFNKVGFSLGAGRTFKPGRIKVSPEVLYTKVGQEGDYRIRVAILF